MIKSTKKYTDSEFLYVGKCEIDLSNFEKVIDNPEKFTSKNSCVTFYENGYETFTGAKNEILSWGYTKEDTEFFVLYDDESDLFDKLNSWMVKKFNLKLVKSSLMCQMPGKVNPLHFDAYVQLRKDFKLNESEFENIRRYIIFLEDKLPGQFFCFGETDIRWEKNDIYTWESGIYHATANSSFEKRVIINVTGVVNGV